MYCSVFENNVNYIFNLEYLTMKKCILFASLFLMTSVVQAATVNLTCPDSSKMRQGTECHPGGGCRPVGILINVNNKHLYANIDSNGAIKIDDEFLNNTIFIKSYDNFWGPSYCENAGSGYLSNVFTLKEVQTIQMELHPR
jgi:hypothetical protein